MPRAATTGVLGRAFHSQAGTPAARPGGGVITLTLPDGVPAEALVAGEAKAAIEG
jgi:hypothetical protein